MKKQPLLIVSLVFITALSIGGCKSSPAESNAVKDPDLAAAENLLEQATAEAEDVADTPEKVVQEAGDKAPAQLADNLPEGEVGHYGAAFSIEGEPLTLAQAIEKAKESEGPYKVAAKIEKVCQKKGCWFTLAADDVEIPVRVQMKDYGFFVPRNADAASVVLEGTLKLTEISQEMAQHFAEDEVEGTDRKPEVVEGPQPTYRFVASGVEVSRS